MWGRNKSLEARPMRDQLNLVIQGIYLAILTRGGGYVFFRKIE